MAVRRHARSQASVAWLLVAVIIGYPVAGLAASALNWDSLIASVPLRVAVLVLSLWVWVRNRNPGDHPGQAWLVGFATLYMIRLVWDAAINSVPGAAEAIVFYLLTVLVPALALWRGVHALDERQAVRLMFGTGTLICTVALVMHLLGIGQDRSLTEATGRLSFEALNPISLGHAAATTLIAAMCMMHKSTRASTIPWLLAGSTVAAVLLMLAASRGPLLCLVFAALVFATATRRWHWLLLFSVTILPWFIDVDAELWQRFTNIEEDDSALERLLLQANAIDQFVGSPFLGSAFVESEFLTYPHNLFIETGMALGFVGLVLLLVLLRHMLGSMVRQLRSGLLLVPLLFLQYFVSAQLSGAIYGNAALWATASVLIGCQARRRRTRPPAPASATSQLVAPLRTQ